MVAKGRWKWLTATVLPGLAALLGCQGEHRGLGLRPQGPAPYVAARPIPAAETPARPLFLSNYAGTTYPGGGRRAALRPVLPLRRDPAAP